MNGRDEDILRAYRAASETLDEQPGASARAAILAAAAREVDAKPEPADRPARRRFSGSRRPLALAAAVLVGAIALTVALQKEEAPGGESVALAPPPISGYEDAPLSDSIAESAPAAAAKPEPAMPAAPPAPRAARSQSPRAAAPAAAKPSSASQPPAETRLAETADDAVPPRPASAAADASAAGRGDTSTAVAEPARAPAAMARTRIATEERREAQSAARAELEAIDDPERWIARIVALREQGRHDDAERELKRLRERFPQTKIPPAALRPFGTR